MPRTYTVEFENVAVTAGQDFFSLDAATDLPIELVGFEIAQNTEVGDAQEEHLRIRVIRGHTTVGSGGAAATPRPVSPGDSAASLTARVNDTTIASAGTAVNLHSTAFNERVGYAWGPVPFGMGFWTSGASLLVVRLLAAPADSLNMSGTATVVEYP